MLPAFRRLARENQLCTQDLIQPLFIGHDLAEAQRIEALPHQWRHCEDSLLREVEELLELGIGTIALFPSLPSELKDSRATEAFQDNSYYRAIRALKSRFPEICLVADVALDPYTDHGHDGIVDEGGIVLNDSTVSLLCQLSLRLAESGVDIVAPSDMMDGRVSAIRRTLDANGFQNTPIISYSVKYASALYGPFRWAVGSTLKAGDKLSYQIQPHNVREALKECLLDEEEGADVLLIKPALLYLDVIAKAKEATHLPIAAYHVSGEYAMAYAAGEKGWLQPHPLLLEMLISIKRAGADMIFTYAAKAFAEGKLNPPSI